MYVQNWGYTVRILSFHSWTFVFQSKTGVLPFSATDSLDHIHSYLLLHMGKMVPKPAATAWLQPVYHPLIPSQDSNSFLVTSERVHSVPICPFNGMRSNPSSFGRIHFGWRINWLLLVQILVLVTNLFVFVAWISSINIPRRPWFSFIPCSRHPNYESSYCLFPFCCGDPQWNWNRIVFLRSVDFSGPVLMLVGYMIELPNVDGTPSWGLTWGWRCGHMHLDEIPFKSMAAV